MHACRERCVLSRTSPFSQPPQPPLTDPGSFTGSKAQCYCWAQTQFKTKQLAGYVTYKPAGQLGDGICEACVTGNDPRAGVLPMPVSICSNGAPSADGKCGGFSGLRSECNTWCLDAQKKYNLQPGEAQCSYSPGRLMNPGSCSLTGKVDPCKML